MLVFSAVYKHQNPDGSVTYSDQPSPGSKEINLPPESIVHEPKQPAIVSPTKPGEKTQDKEKVVSAGKYYKAFAIQDPADGRTFHNQRKIRITILIDPALREGDSIQLLLDSKDYGPPQPGNIFYLNQVDRGSHTVQAKLIDDKGHVVKQTGTITIYIHYASLGFLEKTEESEKGIGASLLKLIRRFTS